MSVCMCVCYYGYSCWYGFCLLATLKCTHTHPPQAERCRFNTREYRSGERWQLEKCHSCSCEVGEGVRVGRVGRNAEL